MANRQRIPFDEYRQKYAENFHAENYDPVRWAELAVAAGMRYAVLTARHHDGFALWPTETSEFHAGAIGPKRDLVEPYVEAFRSAGLKVGLYFSPADWYHPDYPGAYFRDWPAPGDWKDAEARERFIAYYRAQLRELLTGYGKIDYLWYDGCIPNDLQCPEANEEALRLQPQLLINERNGAPSHVHISEQAIRAADSGQLWEACMTLNDNWGYHSGDANWKNPRQVAQMLTETAASEGNLLLNIGPRADGAIPSASEEILHAVGDWLKRNGESIYGSERSGLSWINSGRATVKGNHVYLHLWNDTGGEFCYAEIKNRALSAKLLDGGMPVDFEQIGERLFLRNLPNPQRDPIATTVAIEVEGTPEPITAQTTFWIPGEHAD